MKPPWSFSLSQSFLIHQGPAVFSTILSVPFPQVGPLCTVTETSPLGPLPHAAVAAGLRKQTSIAHRPRHGCSAMLPHGGFNFISL